MTGKFTEEQYQKIVNIWETSFAESFVTRVMDYLGSCGMLDDDDESLLVALAIANPKTREDGRVKYVEKEKRYYWTSKKEDGFGEKARLFMIGNRKSITEYFGDEFDYDSTERLTESEIKAWGFNPEMFDRKEVK